LDYALVCCGMMLTFSYNFSCLCTGSYSFPFKVLILNGRCINFRAFQFESSIYF
jgi:hypothetical protein